MKHPLATSCVLLLLLVAGCPRAPATQVAATQAERAPVGSATAHSPVQRASARVERILAQLTLEEKLGQLSQRTGGRTKSLNTLLDDAELARIREGRVGSYLNVGGAEALRAVQRVAVEESRARIPLLFAGDIIHGYRTIFPIPIAQAASWDPQAVERAARIAAVEASAAGLHWTFAPMVDIARDPRWGRMVEGAGEDPLLGAVMAAAQVRGFQGSDLAAADTILACPKHFAGYGAALGGRDYEGAEISASSLRDVYLPPFRAAIDAGALSLMAAFNEIGGVPASANRPLLSELLRGAWGFRGLVVSDWKAVDELRTHGVAATPAEAAQLAIEAGIDMEMTTELFASTLADRVRAGALPIETVDRAVRRVLHAKEALGLFDDPFRYHDPERERRALHAAEHVQAARELAARSVVLLRNEAGVLPLSKQLRSLAVVGPFADDRLSPLGSWRALGRADEVVSVLAGVRAAAPATRVTYAPGCALDARSQSVMVQGAQQGVAWPESKHLTVWRDSDDLSAIPEALRVARAADVTVLVVGEHGDDSGEARSRAELALSPCQRELASRLAALGKPLVVVLTTSRPLVLGSLADAPTLLLAWQLGSEMGGALSDLLFGDVTPGGKLPVTWPRSVGQIPVFYAHRSSGRPAEETLGADTARYRDLPIGPQFAFGHGLSYTTFSYSALKLERAQVAIDGELKLSFRLSNTGTRSGDEVAQIYVRDRVASSARPVQELRGFTRVSLAPSESVTVHAVIPASMLGFSDPALSYVVEPGTFDLQIGSASDRIALRASFELAGQAARLPTPPTLTSRVRIERAEAPSTAQP